LHHAQNLVVRLALGQRQRQGVVQRHGLEKQLARHALGAGGIQLQPGSQIGVFVGFDQGIQGAADLAAIAGHFGATALVAVQLFEHHHGQEDVVLLKAKQAGGVVQQNVGVQNK